MLDAGWAALLLLACGVAARRDPRRLRVLVLLALALTSAGLAALHAATRSPEPVRSALGWAVTATAAALSAVVAVVLLRDGLAVLRWRGAGFAAVASVVGGAALVLVGCVNAVALATASAALRPVALLLDALAGYGVALFLCFVLVAVLQGRRHRSGPADFVVVLGAGLVAGRVSGLLARRLRRALEVVRAQEQAGRRPVLLLSGGQGPDEIRSEAAAMASWARAQGFPGVRLRLEDRSRNTAENLRNSAALMRAELPGFRCAVVTSNFHVLRTALLARRLGLPAEVVGAPTTGAVWLTSTVREFAAVLWLERDEVLLLSTLLLLPLVRLLTS